MKAFNDLKIGAKLGIAFVTVAVDLAIVALVGFLGMQAINRNLLAAYNDRTRAVESIARANAAFYQLNDALSHYVLLPEQRQAAQGEIAAAQAELDWQMDLYRATYLVQEERDQLALFEPAWSAYLQTLARIQSEVTAGDTEAAHTLLHGPAMQAASQGAVDALGHLVEINDRVARELMHQAQAIFLTTTRDMLVAGAAGVILALVLCAVLTRALARPLRQAAHAANRIAEGDLAQTLEVQSGDEVGELAAAFARMIAYMQEMADVAQCIAAGDLRKTVVPRGERDVLGNAFASMTLYLGEMAEMASCIAQGDLSRPIRPRSPHDLLGNAFAQMLAYLRRMADVADHIAHGDLGINITPQSGRDVLGLASVSMMGYLQEMAINAMHIARGDLSRQITVRSSNDVLGTSFLSMASYLNQVQTVAQQIAQGKLDVRIQPKSPDDALGQAFVRMTDYLRRMVNVAERLAQGDLAVQFVPASRDDALGNAFARLLANLQRRSGAA